MRTREAGLKACSYVAVVVAVVFAALWMGTALIDAQVPAQRCNEAPTRLP